MPKVAVWSLPSLSEASRKSQGKCPADGQRWPKADGQGRLSGRCKPQRHFFSDALPLQLLGVGGLLSPLQLPLKVREHVLSKAIFSDTI